MRISSLRDSISSRSSQRRLILFIQTVKALIKTGKIDLEDRDFVYEIKEENKFNQLLIQNENNQENLEDNEENLIETLNGGLLIENADFYDNNYWNESIKFTFKDSEIK